MRARLVCPPTSCTVLWSLAYGFAEGILAPKTSWPRIVIPRDRIGGGMDAFTAHTSAKFGTSAWSVMVADSLE